MANDDITRRIEKGAEIYRQIKTRLDDYSFRTKLAGGGFISSSDTPGIAMAMVIDMLSQQTPVTTEGGAKVSLDAIVEGIASRMKDMLTAATPQAAITPSTNPELIIPRIDEERIVNDITSRLTEALDSTMKKYSAVRADSQPTAYASNNGRVPYVCVRTVFNFQFDDQDEKINGVNKLLSIVRDQGWNPMPAYFLLGKERAFNGNVEIEGLDLDEITGEWDNAVVFFRNKTSNDKYLRIGISLPEDDTDCTKLWFTHQIPSYVSGIHSLERDFEPNARRELADLTNVLEKQFDDTMEYDPDDNIEIDERANWFEIEKI